MTTGAETPTTCTCAGVDVARDIQRRQVGRPARRRGGGALRALRQPAHGGSRASRSGTIFKLGYKYSDALDLSVLGPDGKAGQADHGAATAIGVGGGAMGRVPSRCTTTRRAIVWPAAGRAVRGGRRSSRSRTDAAGRRGGGRRAYAALRDAGVDVIIDDRPDRAGVKFQRRRACRHPLPASTIGKARPGRQARPSSPSGPPARRSLSRLTTWPKHVREAVTQAIAGAAA